MSEGVWGCEHFWGGACVVRGEIFGLLSKEGHLNLGGRHSVVHNHRICTYNQQLEHAIAPLRALRPVTL